MMKKFITSLLLCVTIVFVACDKEPVTPSVVVAGVSLDKKTLSLDEGITATLVATVTPENAENKLVKWRSSDNDVATVSEAGRVTAVKAGKATITVTTDDGGKEDYCEVTVLAKAVPVTGVTLDKTTLSLPEGRKASLVATIAPITASNKTMTWSSDSDDVAVSTSGVVTAVKEGGTAVITVTTVDGAKTATCTVTVTARGQSYMVGDYYPNPTDVTTAIGVVFYVDQPDGEGKSQIGKIVSIDEAVNLTWDDAMLWTSANAAPTGQTWACPVVNDLQFLYCAYIGVDPRNWMEGVPPPTGPAEISRLNKALADAGTPMTKDYYWAATKLWCVRFSSGATQPFGGVTVKNSVRVTSAF